MSERRWSLVVHGGARTIPHSLHAANRTGCLAAADIGAAVLRVGGSALDAAEHAVRRLEDDSTFNAGSGSVPNADCIVEMDAAIMDGNTLDVGAVAAIKRVRNPVSVARLLLCDRPVLLVGDGAEAFAARHGVRTDNVPAAAKSSTGHDTVGCVARDWSGRIAVATSTGGLSGQPAGRVGDAPVPGCGFYADSTDGGVAISGDGESILRILLAARVMNGLKSQNPADAARAALAALERVGGEAGIIALDRQGCVGIAHNSDHFAVATAASWLPRSVAGIHQSDFEGHKLDD
jgi:beta-aspartyl-peptidase (threonine type)